LTFKDSNDDDKKSISKGSIKNSKESLNDDCKKMNNNQNNDNVSIKDHAVTITNKINLI
jgi:hypothetical protein